MKRISRRDFLRSSGELVVVAAGGSVVLLGACTVPAALPLATAPETPPTGPTPILAAAPTETAAPAAETSAFVPDVEIELKATEGTVQLQPGAPTRVWQYQAALIRGDQANLQPNRDSYLGPLIGVRKGQKVRVRFTNDLPESSIVHWHGLLVPSRMDGHPRDAIAPGQTYVYDFEVINRAGTYWYHPHPEPLTGGQVIKGLAGLFIVFDDEESAAGLPSGEYDIPLVIQDRTFTEDNQFQYVTGHAMPGMASMDMLMGFLGDRILVNGRPDFVLPVATRAYRLRLLNGSNSRVYKLAWGHGAPLTVIATDGGLLEQPVLREYVMLGPGERLEVWADFSQFPLGSEITLQSRAFLGAEGDSLMASSGGPLDATPMPDSMPGMDHGMPSGESGMSAMMTPTPGESRGGDSMGEYNPLLPNGAAFDVMKIRVERQEQGSDLLPPQLSTVARYKLAEAANAEQPRRFGLSMRNMTWLINGRSFELEGVASDEVIKLGAIEAWEFVNEQNPDELMEKMGMVHPMHIHGVQFQVIGREVLVPELARGWDSVREGYVDEGWKDTVLVMPGERVRLLAQFNFPDLFLFHCHNLEHEDLGMMRNYRVDA